MQGNRKWMPPYINHSPPLINPLHCDAFLLHLILKWSSHQVATQAFNRLPYLQPMNADAASWEKCVCVCFCSCLFILSNAFNETRIPFFRNMIIFDEYVVLDCCKSHCQMATVRSNSWHVWIFECVCDKAEIDREGVGRTDTMHALRCICACTWEV